MCAYRGTCGAHLEFVAEGCAIQQERPFGGQQAVCSRQTGGAEEIAGRLVATALRAALRHHTLQRRWNEVRYRLRCACAGLNVPDCCDDTFWSSEFQHDVHACPWTQKLLAERLGAATAP